MRPPVLRSKLRPPLPAPGWVERSRLVERLGRATEPIWVVTAPAGFGKTTLVARVIERGDLRTAWVSLDSADDNPVRFWTHVIAALVDVGIEADAANDPLIDGRTDVAIDVIVAAIEADGADVLLVLDEVHEVTDERVTSGLERLLARPPAGLRIVLTSRNDIDLGLARRRSHGAVLEVGAAELAFTAEEGRAVLADDVDAGLLPEAVADALVERMEGWPAGLQLALLALRSIDADRESDVLDSIGGASPELVRYLATEVVSSLEPDVREFLVDTSVLMDLTPGACDAVTGRTDSLAVLRRLAADQVFTSLVDPGRFTYRTHPIFREFLAAELAAASDDRRRSLHERAVRWFTQAGELDQIIWHAAQADLHDVALETVNEHLITASNRGQLDDMWRWIGWIGAERVLAHSELAALPAWVSLNQRRYEEIDPWLDAIDLVEGLTEEHRHTFALQGLAVRAGRDRHLGDLAAAIGWSSEAIELLAGEDRLIASTIHATHAQLLALTGDAAAVDVARRAVDQAAASGQEPPLAMAYGALALALDDPDAAIAAADSALARIGTADLERFHRPALVWCAKARAELQLGRVGDAQDSADRAIAIAEAGDEPAVVALAEVVRARALHLLGDDEARRAALRRADSVIERLDGADWIASEVREAHNATRFAPGADLDRLPIGARELSERELAVLRLLPYGLSRRKLAAQLFVSENTVKTHLTSIRRKLGVSGRGDVVERAQELGLLDATESDAADG